MMYKQVVARRYAKGLMLAATSSDLDAIEKELHAIVEIMQEEGSALNHLFSDPAFSPFEKKAVIAKITQAYELNPIINNFLALLVDKSRLTILPLIFQAFSNLLDEHHNRLRATIKSADAIEANMLTEINNALKKMCNKDVLADVTVDVSLLGGVRVEMGGMVFDGSVKAKLADMRNRLIASVESNSI